MKCRRFDGTALYEHEDPKKGEHVDWGTLIFNYGRREVINYLVGSALYWIDEFHIDDLVTWAKKDEKRLKWLVEKGFLEEVEGDCNSLQVNIRS